MVCVLQADKYMQPKAAHLFFLNPDKLTKKKKVILASASTKPCQEMERKHPWGNL